MDRKAISIITILVGALLLIVPFTTIFSLSETLKGVLIGVAVGIIANGITLFVQNKTEQKSIATIKDLRKEIFNISTLPHKIAKGIMVYDQFSKIDVTEIISNSKRELKMFVVSGRHIMSPQNLNQIIEKIKDSRDNCKMQVLCLDSISDENFVKARNEMMDLPGVYYSYDRDMQTAREYARQITKEDPEHKHFDIRFYKKLPTTFFIISDNSLYITFLLSKPVSQAPVFKIDISLHPNIAIQFQKHFKYYWNTSRFYASVIGFNKNNNNFIMVHNNKRNGWEWPTGYIEPAENPIESAKREFTEETGLEISDLKIIEHSPSGYYYFGIVGEKIHDISIREISEIKEFVALPSKDQLSFKDDYAMFNKILNDAVVKRKEYSI